MSNYHDMPNSNRACDKRRASELWARAGEGDKPKFSEANGISMAHPDTKGVLARLGDRPIGDAATLRTRLVPELKQLLDEGRAEAEAHLLREQDGLACVRRLSDLMDVVVRLTYDAVLR